MNIKTIEQAEELGLWTYSYSNGDWEYQGNDSYYHLFRNDEELLPKVKKLDVYSFSNGDWKYEDIDGYCHLFRNDKELLPEIKKFDAHSFNNNGDWEYMDENYEWHTIKGDE